MAHLAASCSSAPPARLTRAASSSRTRSSAVLTFVLALGVAAPVVLGPASTAVAQDEATRARAAFDRGTRKFQARRYEQALEAFEEAFSITPHPAVLFNIASCYDRLGRAVEAVNAYRRYLRERGADVEPARRTDVDGALRRLRTEVASLHIVAPAPGIPVMLDGRTVEVGTDPIAVEPGSHVVTSTSPDGREAREEVTALLGETTEVALAFPPPADANPEPGPDGGQGGNGAVTPTPHRDSRGWSPALRWVGIGATVAFAAGWTYTGLQALSINSDYENHPSQDTRDRGLTYRVLADFVFMPATILATGFTVLAFVLARDGADDAPAQTVLRSPMIVPSIAPGALALSLSGSF